MAQTVAKMVEFGVVQEVFPLHDATAREAVRSEIRDLNPLPVLDALRDYFGAKFAFFFGFYLHVMKWLWPIGILGLGLFLYQYVSLCFAVAREDSRFVPQVV